MRNNAYHATAIGKVALLLTGPAMVIRMLRIETQGMEVMVKRSLSGHTMGQLRKDLAAGVESNAPNRVHEFNIIKKMDLS